jgi:glycosyltransferase involved in cell wall biosynthesis
LIKTLKLSVVRTVRRVARVLRYGTPRARLDRLRREFRADLPVGTGDVTLTGILRSPTGIGEGARLMATALDRAGYRVALCDFPEWTPGRAVPPVAGRWSPKDVASSPLIMHANPSLMLRLLGRMPRPVGDRRIIGYWAWELPVIPPSWASALEIVHEVWVPSRFVAEALISSGTTRPIRVVPHPLEPPLAAVRPMELAPGKLVYLAMFSYGSGFERKNVLGAITAFRRAFGDRDDVALVIKTQRISKRPPVSEVTLHRAVSGASNIQVIDEDLPPRERDSLIARADVVVSLHRSEGFGLTLAEAMLLGKPVIATNWSGNTDFMSPDASASIRFSLVPVSDPGGPYANIDSVWADPDLDHAAAEMRRLSDPAARHQMGAAARKASSAFFSLDRFASAVAPGIGHPYAPTASSPAV